MKLFLFQSKTKNVAKDINKFSRAITWIRKIRTPLCKKANLWTFDPLTDFFWNFYEKLGLVKVKHVHPEVTVFCGQFYQEAEIIFDETFWHFNNIPCILLQKLNYLKKKMTLLASLGESKEAFSVTWATLKFKFQRLV